MAPSLQLLKMLYDATGRLFYCKIAWNFIYAPSTNVSDRFDVAKCDINMHNVT